MAKHNPPAPRARRDAAVAAGRTTHLNDEARSERQSGRRRSEFRALLGTERARSETAGVPTRDAASESLDGSRVELSGAQASVLRTSRPRFAEADLACLRYVLGALRETEPFMEHPT